MGLNGLKQGVQDCTPLWRLRENPFSLPFPDSRGHHMSWLMSHPIFKASACPGLVLVYIPLADSFASLLILGTLVITLGQPR